MALITVDARLAVCIAAAWLAEMALGAHGAVPAAVGTLRRAARTLVNAVANSLARTQTSASKQYRSQGEYNAQGGLGAQGGPGAGDVLYVQSGKGVQHGKSRAAKWAGLFLTLYLMLFAFVLTAVFLDFARRLHPAAYYLSNIFICRGMFGVRASIDRALNERKALVGQKANVGCRAEAGSGSPVAAGPDTVWRSIETLAVGAVSGFYAPMLALVAGLFAGVPAAACAAYGAASLLAGADHGFTSPVAAAPRSGDLCWAAKKLCYIARFIPARVFAATAPFFAPACGAGARGAAAGLRATRDAYSAGAHSNNYENQNDALPAAAVAGTLGISPGCAQSHGPGLNTSGRGFYIREPEPRDIKRAATLIAASTAATAAAVFGALLFFFMPAQ